MSHERRVGGEKAQGTLDFIPQVCHFHEGCKHKLSTPSLQHTPEHMCCLHGNTQPEQGRKQCCMMLGITRNKTSRLWPLSP